LNRTGVGNLKADGTVAGIGDDKIKVENIPLANAGADAGAKGVYLANEVVSQLGEGVCFAGHCPHHCLESCFKRLVHRRAAGRFAQHSDCCLGCCFCFRFSQTGSNEPVSNQIRHYRNPYLLRGGALQSLKVARACRYGVHDGIFHKTR
jgi:hypothetical protein